MNASGITHDPGRGTFRRLQVLRARRLTPNMRRVILTGPELAGFSFYRHGLGPYVKLLVPPMNLKDPGWPRIGTDGAFECSADELPSVRTYTVRDFDEERQELTIDFVLHGDEGPASRWAARAEPGDCIALLERGSSQPYGVDRYVFIGDHTALPAIAQSLENLSDSAVGQVVIFLDDVEDKQPLRAPPGLSISWAIGETAVDLRSVIKGSRLQPATSNEYVFLWVGAEAKLARSLRAYAKDDLSLSRDQYSILNYWRRGFSEGAFARNG